MALKDRKGIMRTQFELVLILLGPPGRGKDEPVSDPLRANARVLKRPLTRRDPSRYSSQCTRSPRHQGPAAP